MKERVRALPDVPGTFDEPANPLRVIGDGAACRAGSFASHSTSSSLARTKRFKAQIRVVAGPPAGNFIESWRTFAEIGAGGWCQN
jgi:hypothetical protein